MTRKPAWLVSARKAVDAASSAKSKAHESELISDAAQVLDENMDKLTDLAVAVNLGRKTGWIPDSTQFPSDALATSALEALSTDGLRRGVSQLQRSLPAYVDRLERAVMDLWTAHVRASVGSVSDLVALESLLKSLPGQGKSRGALEDARKPLESLLGTIPDADSVAKLARAADQVNAAFTAAFGVDSVREFLLACARGGASLKLLTVEVRAWLDRTGAVDTLRIRIGAE